MTDRVIEWLDSLDLPPCSCGDDEDALCPSCARMIAVDRLRAQAQAPTWRDVRAGIVADLADELNRSKSAFLEWVSTTHHTFPDPERAHRESRVTALEWAVKAAGSWFPVRRA